MQEKQRALSLFREGNFREAGVCYEQICHEHPLDHEAWLMQGQCLQNMGQLDQAIPLIKHAVKLKPFSAEARYKLGFAWFQKGWIGPFREALRLRVGYCEAHDHLIKALLASRLTQRRMLWYSSGKIPRGECSYILTRIGLLRITNFTL